MPASQKGPYYVVCGFTYDVRKDGRINGLCGYVYDGEQSLVADARAHGHSVYYNDGQGNERVVFDYPTWSKAEYEKAMLPLFNDVGRSGDIV